ncbi:hypothetical protein [Microscilla marina]|uniref:Lipoprotein n=1 Tax=Microscilla marina ATCC 23134 TaxID=313606 RepID=A1ZJ22_MICM2|nr:hypothetical protein [Microscilla marina]EAY29558.1 hypothetical protein M23134_00442 [Microscilla marina ATCC 23134]
MKTILKLSVITIFFSLSATAKPKARVGMQALVKAYFNSPTQANVKFTITKKDLHNGYMKYEASYTNQSITRGELAYYVTNGGQEMLAVTTLMCMQACSTLLQFYGIQQGKLTLLPNQIVGMTMNDFGNRVNQLIKTKMSANERQRQAQGEMALFSDITSLPQHGTTIYIKKDSRVDRNSIVVAELHFDLTTGKFRFVKR